MNYHMNVDGKPKCGKVFTRFPVLTEDPDKVTCKRCLGTVRHAKHDPIKENYVGKYFKHSFGYDMTINEYAKVVAQTEKSLTCVRCHASVSSANGGPWYGTGVSVPGAETGEMFVIRNVKDYGGGYIVGAGAGRHWSIWNGKPNYYNTND